MKIFKKAISLVLVFAMLASFAGMTGYSPASIIAEAESQTFTVGDGKFSVKIPTVLYKSIADGTEASHSSTSTGKEIAGDYIFTAANNPYMAHKFTRLDASIICWQVEWSINGMPFSGFWGSVTADSVDRGTPASAWTSDYSYILASAPWGTLRGKGGYSDVNEIRCRIVYNTVTDTVHDTANRKYTEEWSIPVEFAPSNPSNNTSSTKPLDSKSGINQATIDMPPVLYMNSNGVIVNSIGSSSTTTTLDTTLAITLPSGVTSATLKAVDYGSDSTVYKTWNLASGSNSVDFNSLAGTALTNGNPYLCLRLDYTMNVAHTPYNTPTGNILDSTYDQASSVGKSAYYDNTYGDKSAPDTVTVTYTQYIAAFVTTLPRYYQVGWQTDAATKYSGAEQSLAGVIMLDMAPALATDGINLYGSIRSGESGDYSNAALRENWLESRGNLGLSQTQNNALIWYNSEQKTSCGRNSGVYTSGQFSSSGANSSNRTLGGTIYYDSTTTSAVNLNMKYDFTSSNYTCDKNELEGFWLTWYSGGDRLGYEVIQDGVAGTYLGDGISSHANSNAADSGGLAAYGNVVTKTGGTYPNSGMNFQSSDTTVNFSFNLANATAAGTPYWRCVQQINRPEYSTWGMATNLRCIWGFHIDAIAVDRAAEHYVMTQAISKNFVQAEMDATWWSEYRDEVLFGYYDCGDLRNSGGVEGLFDDKIANGYATDAPVYKTANISELEAAILRTPAYDRGTSQRDANLAAFGLVPVGSKYGDVIAYADGGAQSVDPAVPNATYYNNDTAGNGLNNIDNAAYYRYSGTYFYTDETWRPYATERYYALNIQKYPSANLDVFWYGAGYIYGAGGTFCYCYMQSYIDATTDRLNTAYNNLELRTLAEFKMRNDKNPSDDYDGDGVADNVTAGNGAWVKDSNGNQVIGYDAIMAYLASLIPTDTYTYYTTLSDANGNGKIDALDLDGDGYIDDLNPRTAQVYDTTHLEALLSQMQSKFHEDDTVVDMGLEFEAYIENFLALVEITKRNPQNADNSAWTAIFTYLNGTSVAGDLRPSTGLKAVNFVDEVSKVYTLTDAQKNNFQSLIDTYNSAAAVDPVTYVTTRDALSQGSINTAIGNFFVALQDAFPSIKVIEGGTQANNIAKDPTAVFEIYAPNQSVNITQSIYTADSIAALEAAVNAELGTNSYQFSTTTWQSLVDRYDTIVNWATVHDATTNPDGKLVSSKVNTDRMDIALQNAQNALAADKKSISVTSPDGKTTVAHDKYTPKSVAELEFVIDQAQNIDKNQLYTNQLAVDMITFALWDECDDTKGLLLTSDTALAPRTWSYDANGNPTGYTDDWGSVIMKSFLYGERVEEGNGTDEGLKPNTAYYGFLEAEIKGNTIIKTVTNEETGETTTTVDDTYIGTVWNADGSLILNDNGTPVGDRIFKNWSSYMDAYDAAVALLDAQDKTVAEQSVIDAAAKLLYDKRNALELMNLYFPNNTQDFETAKGWYNELSAYVQKTDVTRYGYEYVDVTEDVTDETTGEVTTVTTTVFQKSADPLSSVVQSVYIYNGVDAAVEAEIESFRAKYASENSTEKYDSLEAAQTLYNNIKAALTDPETNALYTVKKTNDESLTAGMKDLTENYIAGTWTVTYNEETGASTGVYATDLLNSTQAGLLQTYLTNVQNKINSKEDATAGFGGALGVLTTIVFEETQKPATDLQFAEAMKSQVEGFMNMTFDIQLPTFYNGGNAVTAPVFDQKMVAQYKNDIETFYEQTYEWPAIYQIHGLEVTKSTIGTTKDNYFVTKYPSGETTNALVSNATTAHNNNAPDTDDVVDNKIYELFTELGAISHYYEDILAFTNNYHTASLAWIIENAYSKTVEIDGQLVELILADLNGNVDGNEVSSGSTITVEDTLLTAINNVDVPIEQQVPFMVEINYDVRKALNSDYWYTEGYDCYEAADGRAYYNYGDWFKDDTKTTLDDYMTLETNKGYKGLLKARFQTINYAEIGQLTTASLVNTQANQIKSNWTSTKANTFVLQINNAQKVITDAAATIYKDIRALQLRPATEAYRDVYNTYLSVMGLHVNDGDWNTGSFSSYTTAANVDFKFYNVSQASKIANMYSKLDESAVPPYGIVSRGQYGGFLSWYTQADEYADQTNNPWAKMEKFITDFIDGGATITIDQAAKVNTYGEIDGERTIKKILIDDYLSKLEFDDLDYDNLDAVVSAFLGDNLSAGLAEVKGTLQSMGFTVGGNYGGNFYPLNYYTNESLLEVAGILRSEDILAENQIIDEIIGEPGEYMWLGNFPTEKINEYTAGLKGAFYTTTTDQNQIDSSDPTHNSVLLAFLTALNTQLELRGVNIEGLVNQINRGDAVVPEKYDTTQPAWDEYEAALAAAKTLRNNADDYDIRDQVSVIDVATSRLSAAIDALEEIIRADDYAPSMTLKTSVSAVKEFYGKEAYAVALNKADSVSYTVTEADGKTNYDAHPEAGTFFVPNSSGYSLIVYTNELNPRIVINLEDLEQNLNADSAGDPIYQDAAKQEYIAIKAKRTSGVTTNVIAGTIIPAQGSTAEQLQIIGQTDAATGAVEATANNEVTVTNGSNVKGSSAFAILAPIFKSDKTTQAAVYTIEARDGSARSVEGGEILGNPANKFDFGTEQEPIGITVYDTTNSTPRISIYVYYYGLKAADGTEEGINADGTALATPAISGTHVPSALLSGEPGFKGTDWRNGILLQRHFSDSHRVWEYVSEIKQNEKKQYNVNGTQVPLYNDPTFGQLNTGSFYYVLDESVAADADVIAAYNNSNNAVAGCMDYDRATAAKDLMISKINAKDSTVFDAMKESGRLYNYGDYYTDEYGNVLYNGSEPQWINWAQSLNNKVENGDLVFVHVVDRWGNVVNRIVEITNLDKKAPQVKSATSGEVSINEAGGSGIKDITVHNGDFSLGKFDYEINQSQKLTNGQVANNATVESADDTLTIKGLVPGKLYYIGAYDNAGNAGSTPVNASSDGKIALTITVEDDRVETGEENGVTPNSTTFTLNGTDTIILNSGEASSVINADIEGNVFANRLIKHLITTLDTVTGLKTVYQDGTVEEWTSSNARVKDNGDGTLTWTIGRNFAEGEHNYKVYAKVDGEYEKFYAPANFFATNKSVRITYRVSGPGNTVLVYGGASGINNPNYNSLTVPYGSKVTITAETNIEGCEFYYWINNTTDRIISTANVLEFKAVANVDYIAQFTNNSTYTDGKKFVVYVNNAKNVIERFELADGDSYTVPTGPVLPDYTFMGWSMTKAEVLESDKDTIIVEPIYELNASNTVTITQGNYTATGAGTYTAEDNQRAVVTISTSAKDGDGKEFLYWLDADTDEIISYDRTYSFFCVKDTELTPVYGDASTITAEPIVRITEVKFNALSGKVSFFAERSVPEEFVILQTGIVVTKTESIGTNEEVFVVGGTSTAAGTSTSTANNGYYSANTAVATGQTVWARAYVIYETADGEIFEAYGPVVSYTVD